MKIWSNIYDIPVSFKKKQYPMILIWIYGVAYPYFHIFFG